jgi:hypothetical protein
MSSILMNSFAYGELSPRMAGAVNSPAYQGGCRLLENMS